MTSVGFLGLGIMGSRMAANLRRAGYELTVCNRTRAAEAWAQEHGATVADTPGRRRRGRSDVVISMVVDGAAGPRGAAGARRRRRRRRAGTLFVDMSTIAPAQTRAIGAQLAERGIALRRRARHRLLAEGRGRDADDHGRRRAPTTSRAPSRCSRRWASSILHVGELGQGQMVKLINNSVAAANAATRRRRR